MKKVTILFLFSIISCAAHAGRHAGRFTPLIEWCKKGKMRFEQVLEAISFNPPRKFEEFVMLHHDLKTAGYEGITSLDLLKKSQ